MENFRIKQIDSMTFVGVIIVLTPTELKKLECKNLEKSIDNIAKELNIDWAVETDGQQPIVVVSRMYGSEVTVDSAELHDLTIVGTNFLCAISKLELKKALPAIDDEQADKAVEDYKFIKELVEDWEEVVVVKGKDTIKPGIVGFTIMANVANRYAIPCGRVGHDLAKELCMCYLKVHGHDKQD